MFSLNLNINPNNLELITKENYLEYEKSKKFEILLNNTLSKKLFVQLKIEANFRINGNQFIYSIDQVYKNALGYLTNLIDAKIKVESVENKVIIELAAVEKFNDTDQLIAYIYDKCVKNYGCEQLSCVSIHSGQVSLSIKGTVWDGNQIINQTPSKELQLIPITEDLKSKIGDINNKMVNLKSFIMWNENPSLIHQSLADQDIPLGENFTPIYNLTSNNKSYFGRNLQWSCQIDKLHSSKIALVSKENYF